MRNLFILSHSQQIKINWQMKFLERNQMNDTRFSQSFNLIPNKTKVLNTTRASLQKTQQKLPQLNRSYSSTKNTNHKLISMDENVQNLLKKVVDLRLQTRESRRYVNFVREDVGERLLMQDYRQMLRKKVGMLERFGKAIKKQNEERTNRMKEDCDRLSESSINLRNLMQRLSSRADNLEHVMGIYSGKEKHRF